MSLHVERVARKPHVCGWECGDLIEPGTRYIRSSLPPHTEPFEDCDHWISQALHGASLYDCPRYAQPAPDAPRPTP